jgi:CubicO group peptidase (beta-lactamase class C family)
MRPDDTIAHALPRRAALERMAAAAAVMAASPSRAVRPRASHAAPAASLDVERLLRLSRVPSLSMAVVDGGRVTTTSYGVTTTNGTTRATPETVYAAASLTKFVTAYVFLDLVAEGKLSLDKPVGEYVPLPNPDDPRAAKLTARHLLSHSGGWRNWRFGADDKLTTDFEPGSRWQYSGEGYYFLQRVVEQAAGAGFAQVARDRVFTPLGMTRSSLVEIPALTPLIAPPHNVRGEPGTRFGVQLLAQMQSAMAARGQSLEAATYEDALAALKVIDAKLPPFPNFLIPNAAASLLTTAADFGAFLRHLVTAKQQGGRTPTVVDLLMTPQVRCNEAVQWGQGAGLEQVGRRTYAWQWGDNSGYKAFYLADPAHEWGMVVFTNGERGAGVYQRVIRDVTGEDHPAFLWA